ncbi:hypothetical protein D3C76_1874000 [compost metagenome]
MQQAFHESIGKAVHILMESNDWSEAEATKGIYSQFMMGIKPANEILDFVFQNKRLA